MPNNANRGLVNSTIAADGTTFEGAKMPIRAT
jgi:hypothetical protein